MINPFRKLLRLSRIPVPPQQLIDGVGGGDFNGIGKEFFAYFTDLCGLGRGDYVLDVGCGCGRMAVPLVAYLNNRAKYEGFDISEPAIRWCQENISTRYPNFRFRLADLFNTGYNPQGTLLPQEFRFPYEDESFDFVFLTSVFTHMLRADVEHYVGEIVRVMKPKARCLITFFLLTNDSRVLIEQGQSTLTFPYIIKDTAVRYANAPEGAVAFPERDVRDLLTNRGLIIDEPIRFGSWCGRESYLSYQDIVLAHR